MDKLKHDEVPPVFDTPAGWKEAREIQSALVACYARESNPTDHSAKPSGVRRAYHNLDHVFAVNNVLLNMYPYIQDMRLFLYMGWFHDCHYNTRSAKGVNEEFSGQLAYNMLTAAGLPKCDALFVQAGITATSEHPQSRVFGPIIDADLSILASNHEDYVRYTNQLRKEYRWCSPQQWRDGRREWINSMLARKHIYCLGENRALWEKQARHNLLFEHLSL